MPRRKIELPKDHADFVGRLRQRATDLRISLTALAQKAGIPPTTLRNYVTRVDPPRSAILALAKAAGVTPAWLLAGDGDESQPREAGDVDWVRFQKNISDLAVRLGEKELVDWASRSLGLSRLQKMALEQRATVKDLVRLSKNFTFTLSEFFEEDLNPRIFGPIIWLRDKRYIADRIHGYYEKHEWETLSGLVNHLLQLYPGKNLTWFAQQTDEMEPTIVPGDLVIAAGCKEPTHPGVYLFGGTLRTYTARVQVMPSQQFRLSYDHPQMKGTEIFDPSQHKCIGEVVVKATRRLSP